MNDAIEVKRMWEGGPLRQWSAKRIPGAKWVGQAEGGFAGNYVCDLCQRPVDGVYRVRDQQKWLCHPCRKTVRKANRVVDRVSSLPREREKTRPRPKPVMQAQDSFAKPDNQR